MKKITCLSIVLILIVAMLPGLLSSIERDETAILDSDCIAIDGTDKVWDYQQVISKLYPNLIGDNLADALNPYDIDTAPDEVNDTETFWVLSGPNLDTWIQVAATCRAVGEHCYVYVEDAEWGTHITQTEVDEIMDAFDDVVFPVESENFSDLPDYKGQNKVTIFLTDLKDGFDGVTVTQYYAGYFHSLNYTTDTHSNDRHLINIDTYPLIYYGGVADTSDACGVVAHEYQHLLHFWSDPDETTWINEGQSDYAEFLTLGYWRILICRASIATTQSTWSSGIVMM